MPTRSPGGFIHRQRCERSLNDALRHAGTDVGHRNFERIDFVDDRYLHPAVVAIKSLRRIVR